MPSNYPSKILIVRNDKLGDFMLSYPTFALLKKYLPDTQLHALVNRYTQPMAEICEYIDQIKIDPGPKCKTFDFIKFSSDIRKENYDAVITLFSTTRIGILTAISNIPYRLAPATKIAQIFYNHRLKQRRSTSDKPEYVYNMDLAKQLLNELDVEVTSLPSPPYLQFNSSEIKNLRDIFCSTHNIHSNIKLVFIHPGSGGSANNLPISAYAELVHLITSDKPWRPIISAGPADIEQAKQLNNLISDLKPILYYSNSGLVNFAKHLAFADVFISGSTGPLHIAGALDIPTAAFYTRRRSATSIRWQTLNTPSHRLSFSPPEEAHEEDMHSINVYAAAEEISSEFLLS
jgi:ADP-heptose:LPS heptosyltransferase